MDGRWQSVGAGLKAVFERLPRERRQSKSQGGEYSGVFMGVQRFRPRAQPVLNRFLRSPAAEKD